MEALLNAVWLFDIKKKRSARMVQCRRLTQSILIRSFGRDLLPPASAGWWLWSQIPIWDRQTQWRTRLRDTSRQTPPCTGLWVCVQARETCRLLNTCLNEYLQATVDKGSAVFWAQGKCRNFHRYVSLRFLGKMMRIWLNAQNGASVRNSHCRYCRLINRGQLHVKHDH